MRNKFYFQVAKKVLIDGVGPAIHRGLTIEAPVMFFALPESYENGVEKVLEGKTVKLVCRNCNSDPIHEPNGVYSTLNVILSEEKDNSKEVWRSIEKDDFYARFNENGQIASDYVVDMVLDYRLARKLVRRLFDYFFVSIDLITKKFNNNEPKHEFCFGQTYYGMSSPEDVTALQNNSTESEKIP